MENIPPVPVSIHKGSEPNHSLAHTMSTLTTLLTIENAHGTTVGISQQKTVDARGMLQRWCKVMN